MRRSASEVIRNLEIRIARLERQASMRTAGMRDFDDAFEEAEIDTKLRSLDAVELPNGEDAIVANADDMADFLDSMGYVITKIMHQNWRRERGKLYILSSSDSSNNRNKGHLFVVDEKEIRKGPGNRRGYNVYME